MQKHSSNDDDIDEATASRSDDPGQSSYGGFKNEGPADGKNHAADAGERSDAGGIAHGSSTLVSRLSDGVDGEGDGGEVDGGKDVAGPDGAGDDGDGDATSGVVPRATRTPQNRQG